MEPSEARSFLRLRPRKEKPEKKKISNAEKQKHYRERLKLRPDYEKRKEAERERQRLNRKRPKTEEQKEKERENSRRRSTLYRERQKALGLIPPQSRPKTRKEKEKKREYWKLKKRESRARQTAQKKRRVKECDRKRKTVDNSDVEPERKKRRIDVKGFPSKTAEKKAIQRLKKSCPKSPTKMAKVFANVISSSTPLKKVALAEEGVVSPRKSKVISASFNGIKSSIKTLSTSNKKSDKRLRRQLVNACLKTKSTSASRIGKHLGLRWSYLVKCSNLKLSDETKRKDAIPVEITTEVKNYFLHPEVSTPLPHKNSVDKEGNPRHIMSKTLKETYSDFMNNNKSTKVGFSKFASLRPTYVKTHKNERLNQCLCEYCLNVELKIKTLKQFNTLKDATKYSIVNGTMCDKKGKYHKRECIERRCSCCGVREFKERILSTLQQDRDKIVEWYVWGNLRNERKKKGLIRSRGKFSMLLDELCEELEFLAKHLFVAHWEYEQFQQIAANPPDDTIIAVLDFGRNYICEHQDEPQFLFWSHHQITVHPIVCYYKCSQGTCKEIVKEDLVFLSDDITHDAHAVSRFEEEAIEYLTKKGVSCKKLVEFTDGCSSQYKSKMPFEYICTTQGTEVQRCYFGSRHGKGPCDQVIAVVKNNLARAVKMRRVVISNAEEAFHYLNARNEGKVDAKEENEKCQHKCTKVFLIQPSQIDHKKTTEAKTIQGTQKIHSVKKKADDPSVILTRNLSCFCEYCKIENYEQCINSHYVDEWVERDRFPRKRNGKRNQVVGECLQQKPKRVEDKREYFGKLLKDFQECTTFNQLQLICKDEDHILKQFFPIGYKPSSILELKKEVDQMALDLMPEDMENYEHAVFPIKVYGDGNCLPRTASLLAYGTEDCYEEMRARIIVELVNHADEYLDNIILSNGLESLGRKESLPVIYAQYSDFYLPGTHITDETLQLVYEHEVLSIRRNGTYMGIWQIHALASLLGCCVHSICPKYGGFNTRRHLHRKIYPLGKCQLPDNSLPPMVMWTNLQGKSIPEAHWRPNHFVALFPVDTVSISSQRNVEVVEDIQPDIEGSFHSISSLSFDASLFDISPQDDVASPQDNINCQQDGTGSHLYKNSLSQENNPELKDEDTRGLQNEVTTGLQGEDATDLQGEDTTGLQGEDTTDLQGGDTTRPQGEDTTDLQGGDTTDLQGGDTTGPQGEDTTGLQDEHTTGLQGEDTTGLQDEDTTGLQYEDTTWVQDEDTTGVQDEDTTGVQDEDTTGVQDEDTTGVQDEDTTGVQDEDTTRVQDEDTTGVQDEDTTGVQDEDTTGVQDEDNTGVQDEDTTGVQDEDTTGVQDEVTSRLQDEHTTGLQGEDTTGLQGEDTTGVQYEDTTGVQDVDTTGVQEDEDTIGLQEEDTTGVQDEDTTGVQDEDTTRLQDEDTTGLQGEDTTGVQDVDTTGVQEDEDTTGVQEDEDTIGLQEEDTTGVQDEDTTGVQDEVTTRLQVEDTTGVQGEDTTGLQGEDTTGVQDEDTTGVQDEDTTGVQGEVTTRLQVEDTTGVQDEDTTGVQGEDTTGVQDEDTTGVQDEVTTRLQVEDTTGLQGEDTTGVQNEDTTGLQVEDTTGVQDEHTTGLHQDRTRDLIKSNGDTGHNGTDADNDSMIEYRSWSLMMVRSS
ncbi:uncharacterized protein [Argopecten irradians]|uniref:uncharacterized protein n=1 Tax=Argopecten irradians TaxID=31199 RepID=UPI003719FB23